MNSPTRTGVAVLLLAILALAAIATILQVIP